MAKGDVKITLDVDGKPLELTKKQAKGLEKQLDKTGKSAASADRQLKGAARASSNTTKNFSKMSQGISGGLVPAYATLAASLFAAGAAFRFLQDAADLRVLLEGQRSAAMATGIAMNSLSKSLQRATANQITFQEASQAAAIGLAAGLNRDQLDDLAEGANIVSKILGRNVPDSFNRLIRGATKAEPELLDELGIVLRLADATKEYGDMIGVNAEKLTSYQRTQAVTLDITKQIDERFGDLNELVGDNENQFNQLAITLDELVNKLKIFSAAVGEPVARFLNDNILAAASAMGLFAASIIRSVVPSYEEMKQKSIEAAKIQQAGFEATERKIQAADRALERYNRKLDKAGKSSKTLAGQAGAMPGDFAKGKPGSIAALEAGGIGGISRQQKAGLTKAFKAIDKELLDNSTKTIQNRNSMFYGMEKKKVLMYKNSFTQMDNISMTSAQKNKILLKKRALEWQKFTTSISLKWQGAMAVMSRATNAFGRVMAGVARFAGFIGMITLVISLGQQLFQMFKKTNEEIEKYKKQSQDIIDRNKNLADDFEAMAERLAKIPFKDTTTALTFYGNAAKNINLEDFANDVESVSKILGPYKIAIDEVNSSQGKSIMELKYAAQQYEETGKVILGYTKFQIEAYLANKDFGEEARKQRDALLSMMYAYGKIDPEMKGFADILKETGQLEKYQVEYLQERLKIHRGYKDAIDSEVQSEKARKDAITRVNSSLLATDYQTIINSNIDIAKAIRQQIDASQSLSIADKKYNEEREKKAKALEEEATFYKNLQEAIDNAVLATKRLQAQSALASFDTSAQGKRLSAIIGINQQEQSTIQAAQKALAAEKTFQGLTMGTPEYDNAKRNLDLAKEEVLVQHTKLELLRMQNDQYLMMGQNAKNAFEGATSSALKDFITGENGSFTEAIAKIATSTLDSIATSLADMMTGGLMDALFGKKKPEDLIKDGMIEAANYHAKAIKAAIEGKPVPGAPDTATVGGDGGLLSGFKSKIEGMFSGLFGNIGGFFSSMFGGLGSIFGLAKGGVIPMAKGGIKGYAAGGRVDEPTYLVGEGRNSEAVVPLPDNRSIPVKLNGAAGTNNVTVNVSGLGQGQTSTIADQERARAMGDAIAIAVQSELAKQMRPNGMLNKRR